MPLTPFGGQIFLQNTEAIALSLKTKFPEILSGQYSLYIGLISQVLSSWPTADAACDRKQSSATQRVISSDSASVHAEQPEFLRRSRPHHTALCA